jgi:hypothetical protein
LTGGRRARRSARHNLPASLATLRRQEESMEKLGLAAAADWIGATMSLPDTVSAGASVSFKPKLHIQQKTEAKQGKAPRVSEEAARRIAWRSGIDHIEEILLSGERWEVAGRDRTGNEKALDIHAYDGRILN